MFFQFGRIKERMSKTTIINMSGGDKRKRLGLSFLKLVVFVLFTLNLYLFTSNTFNYTTSQSLSEAEIDVGLLVSEMEKHETTEGQKILTSMLTTTTTSNQSVYNYNECNFMRFEDLTPGQCDLVVTVKTTVSNYGIKLEPLLKTWYQLAPSKVVIIEFCFFLNTFIKL